MSEGNQKKSVLFEEFEKLRRETAGINSIMKNPSSGLVSQTTLNEILEVLGKISKKQEELEEKIEKIDQKTEKMEKEILENRKIIENSVGDNRRVQIEIKEQLKVNNQKIEENQKTLEKLENSKEVDERVKQLSGTVDKLVEGLKIAIEKLDHSANPKPSSSNVPQHPKARMFTDDKTMSRETPNKTALFEEFEKLRMEADGIRSSIQSTSTGVMGQPILTEILSTLAKISKKQEDQFELLSGKIEKLEEGQKTIIEKLETIRVEIFDYDNSSRKVYIKVKKSDKIEILESEVIKNFGFKPSRYSLLLRLGWKDLNPESTFEENNLKDGNGIYCDK